MSFRELGIFLKGDYFLKIDNAHLIADDFFGIAYFGVLKRWNGAAWIRGVLKVCDGTNFISKQLKYFDGVEFKLVDTEGI